MGGSGGISLSTYRNHHRDVPGQGGLSLSDYRSTSGPKTFNIPMVAGQTLTKSTLAAQSSCDDGAIVTVNLTGNCYGLGSWAYLIRTDTFWNMTINNHGNIIGHAGYGGTGATNNHATAGGQHGQGGSAGLYFWPCTNTTFNNYGKIVSGGGGGGGGGRGAYYVYVSGFKGSNGYNQWHYGGGGGGGGGAGYGGTAGSRGSGVTSGTNGTAGSAYGYGTGGYGQLMPNGTTRGGWGGRGGVNGGNGLPGTAADGGYGGAGSPYATAHRTRVTFINRSGGSVSGGFN